MVMKTVKSIINERKIINKKIEFDNENKYLNSIVDRILEAEKKLNITQNDLIPQLILVNKLETEICDLEREDI
jgi:hypothetical protein